MYGFKQVNANEHSFARFLRAQKATDNWQSQDDSNVWFNPAGESVAIILYDKMEFANSFWIRESLTFD